MVALRLPKRSTSAPLLTDSTTVRICRDARTKAIRKGSSTLISPATNRAADIVARVCKGPKKNAAA